jgi:hypothetical protein
MGVVVSPASTLSQSGGAPAFSVETARLTTESSTQELHEIRTVRIPHHPWFPHLRAHNDACARSADVSQLRRQSWIPCHLRDVETTIEPFGLDRRRS